jgi:hypothetical protein
MHVRHDTSARKPVDQRSGAARLQDHDDITIRQQMATNTIHRAHLTHHARIRLRLGRNALDDQLRGVDLEVLARHTAEAPCAPAKPILSTGRSELVRAPRHICSHHRSPVVAQSVTWWINPDSHTTHRDEFSFRDRSACIQDRELVAARQVVTPDALELTRLPVDACEFPVL